MPHRGRTLDDRYLRFAQNVWPTKIGHVRKNKVFPAPSPCAAPIAAFDKHAAPSRHFGRETRSADINDFLCHISDFLYLIPQRIVGFLAAIVPEIQTLSAAARQQKKFRLGNARAWRGLVVARRLVRAVARMR
jgi:hypothetical protein